jgi:hypothetical protein
VLIPRWLLVGVGLLAAVVAGRVLYSVLADGSRPESAAPADSPPPASVVPRALPGDDPAVRPVNVTIIVAAAPGSSAAPEVEAQGTVGTVLAALVPGLVATPAYTLAPSFRHVEAPTSSPMQRLYLNVGDAGSVPAPALYADVGEAGSVPAPALYVGVGGLESASPPTAAPVRYLGDVASAVPTPRPTHTPTQTSPGPRVIRGPERVDGLSVIANGDDIVIANNGSIVSVGDDTVVKANTGDAGASGVIALDVVDSTLSSGSSSVSGLADEPSRTTQQTIQERPTGPGGSRPVADSTSSTSSAPAGGGPHTRAVALAGYENKALEVAGNDNLLTYDDSNLFYRRAGNFNGNTGDTGTSGVNVVDAARSVVRTGESRASPDPPPVNQAPVKPVVGSSPGVAGSNAAPGTAATASVASANNIATATSADSLVIGGEGVTDKGVRVHGERNVATYDDGNVAVGGVGDANAQIGDSGTSGAEVMSVTDSEITTGSSTRPTSAPVGTQVPNPLPGDDVTSQPPTLP